MPGYARSRRKRKPPRLVLVLRDIRQLGGVVVACYGSSTHAIEKCVFGEVSLTASQRVRACR